MTTMTPPNAGEINLPSSGHATTKSPVGISEARSSSLSLPAETPPPKPSSTPTSVPTSSGKLRPTNSTPSNNYAAPNTPIASAKRPRNQTNHSAIKSHGKTMTNCRKNRVGSSQHKNGREIVNSSNNSNHNINHKVDEPLTPVRKMRLSDGNTHNNQDNIDNNHVNKNVDRVQMSPMHKPRPAIEKDNKKINRKQTITSDEILHGEEVDNEEVLNGDSNDNVGKKNFFGMFSPVLKYLGHSNEDGMEDSNQQDEVFVLHDVDGDVTMENSEVVTSQLKSSDGQNGEDFENESINANTSTSANTFSVSLPHSRSSMDASEDYGVPDDHVAILEDGDNTDVDTDPDHPNHNQENHPNDDEEEDEEDEFNPYLFIKFLPPYQMTVPHPERNIRLPPKDTSDPPITLVLDLDETLVHCTVEPISDACMVFPVYFNGIQYSVHVRTRPYLQEFLESVSKKFEVVVFTASQKVYADELLNRIDPDGKLIKHRMFRESCLLVEGNYIKDLNVLGRDLTASVLVDNSPHAFGYQVDNGIPIESWFDDRNDIELKKLDHFLDTLHGMKDVRTAVRSKFQTYKLVRDAA